MKVAFNLSKVDFRTTPIENMFLDTYLTQASANALKVYLYGWRSCYANPEEGFDLSHIAMDEKELEEALTYWVNEGLVEIKEVDGKRIAYFKSLMLLWMGLYDTNEESKPVASSEGDRRALFDRLEGYLSMDLSYDVLLKENEIVAIHSLLDQYPITEDFFFYAYQKATQMSEAASRSFNYVLRIIENWMRFDQITDEKALDAFLEKQKESKKAQRKPKKSGKLIATDPRMSKSERSQWVKERLEQSRRGSLRGDGDE